MFCRLRGLILLLCVFRCEVDCLCYGIVAAWGCCLGAFISCVVGLRLSFHVLL